MLRANLLLTVVISFAAARSFLTQILEREHVNVS
jgi:hypothetical protein